MAETARSLLENKSGQLCKYECVCTERATGVCEAVIRGTRADGQRFFEKFSLLAAELADKSNQIVIEAFRARVKAAVERIELRAAGEGPTVTDAVAACNRCDGVQAEGAD